MSKPIKTCILGVGLAGLTFHAPFVLALPDKFILYAVLERNPQTPGGKLQDRFGISVKIHRSLEDVLADLDIELIIIGTPNDTHYAFAKAALNAGKHVLVDKPITATSIQARELGELARSKGLVLCAFQNRRWDSDFLALKKLLRLPNTSEYYLGEIHEFESHFDRYRRELKGTWKDQPLPASGQTYDLGAHLIDQTLALFGRPHKITGFIQNIRGNGNINVDDTFFIHLHYAAGTASPLPLTAILRSHILSVRSPQVRYIVRGNNGTYTKYGLDVQEDQLKIIPTPMDIYESDFGKEPQDMWGELDVFEQGSSTIRKSRWPSEDPGSYLTLFKNLAASVRGEEELMIKWEEASMVIELIELAYESSKLGKTVDVPP